MFLVCFLIFLGLFKKKNFLDASVTFQFRANVKENILGQNQIFAYAFGYRANYPIENGKRAKRSEVYDTIEDLISQ